MVEVRQEQPNDIVAIRVVNQRAFGQDQEANIVDALRANSAVLLSLVAVQNSRVVGHVMYSPVLVGGEVSGAALGPLAVLPELQRQGIGTKLVETGNAKLRATGCPFIVVLGHRDYYPRFGFRLANGYGIESEWVVRDGAFMLLVLDERKMQDVTGLAKYRAEFSSVTFLKRHIGR